ncbi:hypothetical protein AGMMS50212_12970 [Spirochaetia bacterium]|nr:hypothetical protein AGMMS50212_12970 [Spirochaetia bacterium]
MNKKEWNDFNDCRCRFKQFVEETGAKNPQIKQLQNKLIAARDGPKYEIVYPVVYNTALDDVKQNDDIKLILVGDNPGRREQESGRYLVGPSGKIAENFFRNNPELGIDFRKNVIILNKTPIHTPRTIELKELKYPKNGTEKNMEKIICDTQIFMADMLCGFFKAAKADIWIIGYSEMKANGVFSIYTERLKALIANNEIEKQEVFIFRHFSMNQFTIDLKKQILPQEAITAALKRIGGTYRKKTLGL